MLNLRRWGLLAPKTPRCFLVLDYLFSSTKKLQFYVELASLLRRCSFPPSKKASAGVFSCAVAAIPNVRQVANNNNFTFCILTKLSFSAAKVRL